MRYRYWTLLFLCASARAAAPNTHPPSIVLTASENGVESQKEFSCYGKVHGYVRLASPETGDHLLESRWTSPRGKIEADSSTPLHFNPARSTAYVWFAFPESPALGLSDPELEQDRLTFNGLWHLDLLWDGQTLLKTDFNVRCP
jgi:hypothetical protein